MMRTGSVLVVTPHLSLRASIGAVIAGIGSMSVKSFGSAADALGDIGKATKLPDLALLELPADNEPDLAETLALCERLDRSGEGSAVMVMARGGSEGDILRGLQAGARDAVQLPFGQHELAARIRVLIRGQMRQSKARFQIGAYILSPSESLLYNRDLSRSVALTDKEVNIIRFLYQSEGTVISKLELLRHVWNYSPHSDTHTLETHMYRLRLKFEGLVARRQPIETVGGGYRIGPAPEDDLTPARYRMRWPRRGSEMAAWSEAASQAERRGGLSIPAE